MKLAKLTRNGGRMKSLDQFLCEDVMGECWHERDTEIGYGWRCGKCHADLPGIMLVRNPSFSSWQDYGRLVEFLDRDGRLEQILKEMYRAWKISGDCFTYMFANPTRGSRAFAEFFGWKDTWTQEELDEAKKKASEVSEQIGWKEPTK